MRVRLLTQGWLVVVTVVTVALASCVPAADESAVPVQEAAPSAMAYTPPTVPPESHDLNQADIERLMEELSNWGRWGPSDELGAANLITPAKRLEAIALATEGITLTFKPDAVDRIAEFATLVNERSENIGARRLHTVMEKLLDEISFNAPELDEKTIVIDAAYVDRMLADIVNNEDLSRYIL